MPSGKRLYRIPEEVIVFFLLTQEITIKDDDSDHEKSPPHERSPLHQSPSLPRLTSRPTTPEMHPKATLACRPSLRKQSLTYEVPQHTLQLKLPESPQQIRPKTLPIFISQPVSSRPVSD